MIYWLAKIFQAAGLTLMGWGFFTHYPKLMPHDMFLMAGILFVIGWVIQSFLLKK